MARITTLGMLGVALVGVAGCDPEINVREKWGKSIANYGLRGVYPMRENLYPGDIYLYVPNGCGENYVTSISEMMLLGALPPAEIKHAFEQFYGSRPSFPRNPLAAAKGSSSSSTTTATLPQGKFSLTAQGPFTANVEAGAATTTVKEKTSTETSSDKVSASPQDSPEADSKNPIFNPGRERFTRLPMAALPNISLYNSIGGTAGGAWNWISGAIGGEDARKVRISATQVEMAELPANAFQQLVMNFMRGPYWSAFESNARSAAGQLRQEMRRPGRNRRPAHVRQQRLLHAQPDFRIRQRQRLCRETRRVVAGRRRCRCASDALQSTRLASREPLESGGGFLARASGQSCDDVRRARRRAHPGRWL